jgi:hypothetical protein
VTERKHCEPTEEGGLGEEVGEIGGGERLEEAQWRVLAFMVASDGCKVLVVVCIWEVFG